MDGQSMDYPDDIAPSKYAVTSDRILMSDDGQPYPEEGHVGDHLYIYKDGVYEFVD